MNHFMLAYIELCMPFCGPLTQCEEIVTVGSYFNVPNRDLGCNIFQGYVFLWKNLHAIYIFIYPVVWAVALQSIMLDGVNMI